MHRMGIALLLLITLIAAIVPGCTSPAPPQDAPAATALGDTATPLETETATGESSPAAASEEQAATPAVSETPAAEAVNGTAEPAAGDTPAPIIAVPSVVQAVPAVTVTKAAADPEDLAQIVFLRYSDSDFTLDYPSTWTVEHSSYVSSICTSTATNRCYEKEVRETGPFDFNEYAFLKKPTRIVTFTSADKTQKIVSFVADFREGMSNNLQLDPTLEWCKERVVTSYPDVSGSAVGDYQYSATGNTRTSIHTVMTAPGSSVYPLAYTMKNIVTTHRTAEFAFISDVDNIQKYRYLRDRMIGSIQVED